MDPFLMDVSGTFCAEKIVNRHGHCCPAADFHLFRTACPNSVSLRPALDQKASTSEISVLLFARQSAPDFSSAFRC